MSNQYPSSYSQSGGTAAPSQPQQGYSGQPIYGGGFTSGSPAGQGGYSSQQSYNQSSNQFPQSGGYNSQQGGYNSGGGGNTSGGDYSSRGSYNSGDGYNKSRGGYHNTRGSYNNSSGSGFDNSGGNYDSYSRGEGGGGRGYSGGGGGYRDRSDNGYGSRGGGGYRGRGGSRGGSNFAASQQVKDGMIIQEDTVFVSGLPPSATPKEIGDFFGQIGIVKTDKRTREPKIWIYKHPDGSGKGECTVTYEDAEASVAAVEWFNGKSFGANPIKVSIAQRKAPVDGFAKGRGRGRGRGFGRGGGDRGGRGGGGGRGERRDGDWSCPSCDNLNFARRNECNQCGEGKPGGGGGGGYGGGRGGGRGRDDRRSRPY